MSDTGILTYKSFADFLKMKMEKCNYDVKSFSEKSGLPKNRIHQILHGAINITASELYLFVLTFKLSDKEQILMLKLAGYDYSKQENK